MQRGIVWKVAVPCLALLLLGGGCAQNPKNPDPFEKCNRFFYKVNDGLDKILLKRHIKDGVASVGRMAVNSTVGVAGVFDVATKWNLPSHSNDFGITLGKWGAGPGPYLVLPLYGPSTFRDVTRIPVGMYTNVLHYVEMPNYVSIPLDVLNLAEDRSRADAAIKFRDEAAIDPYIFMREAYLQFRRIKIYGADRVPPTMEPGFYDEDEGPTTRPTTRPTTGPVPDLSRIPFVR